MSVTVRSIIIAAVLMICAALLYRYSNVTGQISSDELSSRFPTFVASKFTGETFNTNGQLDNSLFADKLQYFKSRNEVEATNLIGFYYDNKDPTMPFRGWQISASNGQVIMDKQATLSGNIKIVPNYVSAPIKEIDTESLYFDIPKRTISSTDKIVIKGDHFVNTGSNYVVDLNKKTFIIKDSPHVVYNPNTP